MKPLHLLIRPCAMLIVASSLASACPLGDCGHTAGAPVVNPNEGDRPQIHAGITGSLAPQVDLAGTPVTPGRVVVFLEHRLGKYPRIHRGRLQNGGIPQRVNLQEHRAKIASDIARDIPDPNFDGYAVIDYEGWEPFWDNNYTNADLYRAESIRYVRQRFPGLSQAAAEARAKQEFETAGRNLMIETLRECKRLRPNAKWGFYGYLPGYQDQGVETSVGLSWMWDEVGAIYPSNYVRNYSRPTQTRERGEWHIDEFRAVVQQKMDAALSVADGRPVLVFVYRLYKDNNPVYGGQPLNDLDFEAAFVLPIELGADSLILWDSVNTVAERRAVERDLRTGGLLRQRLDAADVFNEDGGVVVAPERRRAGD